MSSAPTILATLVCDVMTVRATPVPPHMPAAAARKVAALRSVDHLLIEQGGRLLGIVSGIDLVAARDDEPVGALARPFSSTLRPETPLERARDLMVKGRVGCLPVFAGVWLVGIVTRDAVERALRAREHAAAAA